MSKHAIVLGSGLVGSVIAQDLANEPDLQVTIADINDARLKRVATAEARVKTLQADLADRSALARLIEPFDLVLGAMPSRFGYQTLDVVIDARKPYADISFMPENPLELHSKAEAAGVSAVVDCGVAPGLSHILAAEGDRSLDQCRSIEIYVGGLPAERRWPFEYKAGFAPADVIEEYTRPSRLVEHGMIVTRPALSEPELMDFDGVGTLEAFNTDGLRSLVHTLDVPFMKEKTLRYPGHIELMRVFRETGLFSQEPLTVGGTTVRPLDVTSALLFPKWTFEEGEADVTVLRVIAHGQRDGRPTMLRWDMTDRLDPVTGWTSMSRTTAFPCAIVGRMLLEGRITTPGVHPPEWLAKAGLTDAIVDGLAHRSVRVTGP